MPCSSHQYNEKALHASTITTKMILQENKSFYHYFLAFSNKFLSPVLGFQKKGGSQRRCQEPSAFHRVYSLLKVRKVDLLPCFVLIILLYQSEIRKRGATINASECSIEQNASEYSREHTHTLSLSLSLIYDTHKPCPHKHKHAHKSRMQVAPTWGHLRPNFTGNLVQPRFINI